jgi:hypothetical protein
MMKIILGFLVVGIILVGVSTALVDDSPYDSNVHSERNPTTPERPTTLNRTTATEYLIAYEEMRLYNDLLSSRGFVLDMHDTIQATCTGISVNETATDRFLVRLRCHGDIDDTKRLFEPRGFAYTVTYRLTEATQKQIDIHGYLYRTRDELHPLHTST